VRARLLLALSTLGILGGCATYRIVTAADGLPALHLTCRDDQLRCAQKAERLCPRGFQVLDDGTRYQTVVWPNGVVNTMKPVFHGYSVVRCR
jgi:hypothetical protein